MSREREECKFDEEREVRRGPWTLEEDSILIHYIACHGEGKWNLLARSSGLKRTGKSCRLRWLNYLKPDIKRGNLSVEEQYLIIELHSIWGNRWSRIAQYLPGRTDNEIKNYWRTRVQKQARQLNIDANNPILHRYWIAKLLENRGSSSSQQAQHINYYNCRNQSKPSQMISSNELSPFTMQNLYTHDHELMSPNEFNGFACNDDNFLSGHSMDYIGYGFDSSGLAQEFCVGDYGNCEGFFNGDSLWRDELWN